MIFTKHRNFFRWFIVVASFAIVSLILWNTYVFFQNFKAEERSKMKNWSFAQTDILNASNLDGDIGELPLQVIRSNTTTPMILVDQNGEIQVNNINTEKIKDTAYINKFLSFQMRTAPLKCVFKMKFWQRYIMAIHLCLIN